MFKVCELLLKQVFYNHQLIFELFINIMLMIQLI